GERADLAAFLGTLTGAPLSPDLLLPVPRTPAANGGAPAAGAAGAVPPGVQAIFMGAGCSSCHTSGGALPPRLDNPAAACATLVGVSVAGMGCMSRVRVVPGNAAASYLVAKLRGTAPLCGVRMPYGAPPLPEAQIQTIEAWINGLPR